MRGRHLPYPDSQLPFGCQGPLPFSARPPSTWQRASNGHSSVRRATSRHRCPGASPGRATLSATFVSFWAPSQTLLARPYVSGQQNGIGEMPSKPSRTRSFVTGGCPANNCASACTTGASTN